MGRRHGSRDRRKRSTANYRGRLPGAKDVQQRDGYNVWLYHQDKDFSKDRIRLNPDFAPIYWRARYLYLLFGVHRPKRYRFNVLKPIQWVRYPLIGETPQYTDEQLEHIYRENRKRKAVLASYEAELFELEAKSRAFKGKVWTYENDTN